MYQVAVMWETAFVCSGLSVCLFHVPVGSVLACVMVYQHICGLMCASVGSHVPTCM